MGWTSIAGNLVLAAGAFAAATQPVVDAAVPWSSAELAVGDSVALCALAILLAGAYWLALYAESVTARLSERYETGEVT